MSHGRHPPTPCKPDELLIHPDDEPDHDSPDPFGTPGAPVSRHSPFYVGFFGGLGVLVAIVLGLAIREVRSALVLVVVSMFLAVGLNPLVEWLMHRGLRRPWSVFVVALGVLGVVTLFVVALVPVLRDQITALIDDVPGWLDDLQQEPDRPDLDRQVRRDRQGQGEGAERRLRPDRPSAACSPSASPC